MNQRRSRGILLVLLTAIVLESITMSFQMSFKHLMQAFLPLLCHCFDLELKSAKSLGVLSFTCSEFCKCS